MPHSVPKELFSSFLVGCTKVWPRASLSLPTMRPLIDDQNLLVLVVLHRQTSVAQATLKGPQT